MSGLLLYSHPRSTRFTIRASQTSSLLSEHARMNYQELSVICRSGKRGGASVASVASAANVASVASVASVAILGQNCTIQQPTKITKITQKCTVIFIQIIMQTSKPEFLNNMQQKEESKPAKMSSSF